MMKVNGKNKPPTSKQRALLQKIGIESEPTNRADAQALISNHFRPKPSRRRRMRPMPKGRVHRWSTTPNLNPVIVRFECPICGEPHPRSEHPMTATDQFSE